MKAFAHWLALLGLGCSLLLGGCAEEVILDHSTLSPQAFPGIGAGKADVFGRALVGVAVPYPADATLRAQEERLFSDMAYRRQIGWDIALRVLQPVPLLGLAELEKRHESIALPNGVPLVPRWQTWYGVDDFKRMFQKLYNDLGAEGRAARSPFTEEALHDIVEWNASAVERSERWPLERFLKHVESLGVCPAGQAADACAQSLQSQFSGAAAGNARISYSPATVMHVLRNYGQIMSCQSGLKTLDFNATADNPDENFSFCLSAEFPHDAVLLKAHWVRSDFNRTLPVFDTDGQHLSDLLDPSRTADWGDGDRQADPNASDIYTIQLRNGDTYRLSALHIMTKELRHWVWITLWWSDKPNEDFGADRPAAFTASLGPMWSHYKMTVAVDYKEHDPNPAARFADKPSLAAALEATTSELTWSSNPYIEHGRGNARTNCIGCHQHGGSAVGHDQDGDGTLDPFDLEQVIDKENLFPSNGRAQMRTLFPTDYLWSTQRVDNLAQLIRSEVDRHDYTDGNTTAARVTKILEISGSVEQGAGLFAANCSTCHGPEGKGTHSAPSLFERVPGLSDTVLVTTLLEGKSPMPSWGHLEDGPIADLRAFLQDNFLSSP